MAVQPFVTTQPGNLLKGVWLALASGDTGKPISLAQYLVTTLTFYGTFGSGGSVTLEVSPDNGTTWVNAANAFSSLPATAAGLSGGFLPVDLIRPRVTAGDGTTSINVQIIASVANSDY